MQAFKGDIGGVGKQMRCRVLDIDLYRLRFGADAQQSRRLVADDEKIAAPVEGYPVWEARQITGTGFESYFERHLRINDW